ncbi:MAG: hypothetical protein M3N68_08585 [Actinomycetota bacterium]|nr:hypothetical protein [Actinomycetota bacterium]
MGDVRRDEYGAGVDTDPGPQQVDVPGPRNLVAVDLDLSFQLHCGEDGPLRIVLVGERRAEKGGNAGGRAFDDCAVQCLDAGCHAVQGTLHYEGQFVGVESVGQRGGADEVGDQGRHQPHLLDRRADVYRRGFPRAAGEGWSDIGAHPRRPVRNRRVELGVLLQDAGLQLA